MPLHFPQIMAGTESNHVPVALHMPPQVSCVNIHFQAPTVRSRGLRTGDISDVLRSVRMFCFDQSVKPAPGGYLACVRSRDEKDQRFQIFLPRPGDGSDTFKVVETASAFNQFYCFSLAAFQLGRCPCHSGETEIVIFDLILKSTIRHLA